MGFIPTREEPGRGQVAECAAFPPGRRLLPAAIFAAILLIFAGEMSGFAWPSPANQKKSKKNSDPASLMNPLVPLPDTEAIDLRVSQMLGAWQIGDLQAMHKYYADDVVVVSGSWEQPLIGWQAYARAYETERAHTEASHLDRSNTYSKVMGDTAWVTYQWKFTGEVDGHEVADYGHTTLVLQNRAGNWLIVLNHTSGTPPPQAPGEPAPTQLPAGKPGR